jgi:hypothetical protein
LEETLKVFLQVLLVLLRRLAVDARGPALASEAKGLFQPVDVDQVAGAT